MNGELEYNTTREKMLIPEYGRNVQKMIQYIRTVDDREKRTRLAHAVVSIMGQLNPAQKDAGDFQQKLWDHLHIISGFDLDIDSPYPKPAASALEARPDPIPYATGGIRYSHYGKHIQGIIDKVVELEEGEDKQVLIRVIANHLKKSYLTWNRDSVTDELIARHLYELSHGKMELGEEIKLMNTTDILQRNALPPQPQKKKYGKDNRKAGNAKQKRPHRNM
ncbi:MAG TPA: DUF4290 domain-containing protein [Bacteroidales bacterium]|nr:DUF4290 domain-containing protein [Bacteroidales bacterium]